MKWIHTSDLHIGKQLNEFSLLEDQRFFLQQLAGLVEQEQPDALLIAGDLYDRSVPPAEAVSVLDEFLSWITVDLKTPVLAIAGNHDSPQRLDFCRRLLSASGLYLSGQYQKQLECVTLSDSWGPVHFYLCPYVEPALVRSDFQNPELRSFDDAFQALLSENLPQIDFQQRNVILAHGFFSYLKNPDSVARSESEVSLGGSDLIDARSLEPFDYAALGHLHRAQSTGIPSLCYSGSPLPYSISEIPSQKSVAIVELKEKGDLSVRRKQLPKLRQMRIIQGYLDEILRAVPTTEQANDLVFFSLSDKVLAPNAMNRLRAIYPNALGLRLLTQNESEALPLSSLQASKPMDLLFGEFYQAITGDALSDKQQDIVKEVCQSLVSGGGMDETDPFGM